MIVFGRQLLNDREQFTMPLQIFFQDVCASVVLEIMISLPCDNLEPSRVDKPSSIDAAGALKLSVRKPAYCQAHSGDHPASLLSWTDEQCFWGTEL